MTLHENDKDQVNDQSLTGRLREIGPEPGEEIGRAHV